MQFLLKSISWWTSNGRKTDGVVSMHVEKERKEAIPQDLKDASIIHLYKRKGNPQVCDNHRGISLLSIAGKILAKFY